MKDKKQTEDLTQLLEVINAKGDQDELKDIVEDKDKEKTFNKRNLLP